MGTRIGYKSRRDVLLVPAFITPLIDTEEQDCCPVRVEGEENAPGDREPRYVGARQNGGYCQDCPTMSAAGPRGPRRTHAGADEQSVRAVSRRDAHLLVSSAGGGSRRGSSPGLPPRRRGGSPATPRGFGPGSSHPEPLRPSQSTIRRAAGSQRYSSLPWNASKRPPQSHQMATNCRSAGWSARCRAADSSSPAGNPLTGQGLSGVGSGPYAHQKSGLASSVECRLMELLTMPSITRLSWTERRNNST